ncbi:DUF4440 domain-containing protein [Erythrobacter jejuensis]|uniref:DUF4440 domain-containing protein n=2 Tax=Parerythrobacter jejuensis TaxID=795812 RepID=A0A845APT4_9SPHN|nr:DUF4440 domain-containing protein [Parerythrobacter jejuensis]
MQDLADTLFRAFEAGDAEGARACLADDFALVQNGGRPMDRETLITFARAFRSVVSGYRYEKPQFSTTDSGFVREHEVCGTLPDGSELRFAACVVAEVTDGKITAVREYLDTPKAAGVAKALSA